MNKDLAIVTSYFNPANYKNKSKLHAECKQRIPELFTVECLFADNNGRLRESEIDSDIQVTGDVMWQKERLLNIAISDRLAAGYKNVCWIDFDAEFTDSNWRENILDKLQTKNLVQCFSTFTSEFTDKQLNGESIVVLYSDCERINARSSAKGGAWAANRRLLSNGFTLYDRHIGGSGDSILVWLLRYSMNGKIPNSTTVCRYNKKLEHSIYEWLVSNSSAVKNNFGFSKNHVIFHSHGKSTDRQYDSLDIALAYNSFDPHVDIKIGESGAFEWNSDKPELHNFMSNYFKERLED